MNAQREFTVAMFELKIVERTCTITSKEMLWFS
jgi:hypothetical protein